MTRILAGAVAAALSFVAAATPALAQSGESAVRGAIETLVPNAKIDSVMESVVPSLYEVTIEGRVVYVTADGRYLIQGSLFDIPNRQYHIFGATIIPQDFWMLSLLLLFFAITVPSR